MNTDPLDEWMSRLNADLSRVQEAFGDEYAAMECASGSSDSDEWNPLNVK